MPEPLPQAFLYVAFNPILDQKSGSQGCLCSGSPLHSATDLVPLCLSSQSLQHFAESMDGAFQALQLVSLAVRANWYTPLILQGRA